MRFKTFRTILISGVAIVGIGGLVAVSTCCKKEEKKPEIAASKPEPKPVAKPVPLPTATATATATATTAEAANDPGALRPMDQKILDLIAKPATTDKIKDAFPGQPWKVNIYREAGATKFNRVKIDYNRNEKWEEKWSIDTDDGQEVVKRQVAPADDEKYTEEFRLKAGKWAPKK